MLRLERISQLSFDGCGRHSMVSALGHTANEIVLVLEILIPHTCTAMLQDKVDGIDYFSNEAARRFHCNAAPFSRNVYVDRRQSLVSMINPWFGQGQPICGDGLSSVPRGQSAVVIDGTFRSSTCGILILMLSYAWLELPCNLQLCCSLLQSLPHVV